MIPLVIDIQDGFLEDTVAIKVDNEEIFYKKDVNTDYSLGRADSVEVQVSEGTINVEITVLSRHISGVISIKVSAKIYLGVSIVDNKIDFKISDEMFLYY